MKSATIYLKAGALYFHGSSKTTDGVWIATPPFLRLEAKAAPAEKGIAAIEALDASKDGVPHPTNWKRVISPLLELAKVKSWSTLAKGAICLTLESDGEQLKVIPNQFLGPTEGFEPVAEGAVTIAISSSADEIGSVLEKALTGCA
jgi:hypothetical protein